MSTRAIVARALPDGGWEGHQVHANGMPTSLGKTVHGLFGHFGSPEAMGEFFVNTHQGFLQVDDITDVRVEGTPAAQRPDFNTDEAAYRAWQRSTIADSGPADGSRWPPYTHRDIGTDDGPWDIRWLYVIEPDGLAVHLGHPTFERVGLCPWGQEITDTEWQVLECGEDFERCGHYAWVHFPDMPEESRRLSTSAYLGRDPLRHHDAIALIVDGQRLELTGSGGRERRGAGEYGDRWLSCVRHPDGTTTDVASHYVCGPKVGLWVEGVQPVFPPLAVKVPAWWQPPRLPA